MLYRCCRVRKSGARSLPISRYFSNNNQENVVSDSISSKGNKEIYKGTFTTLLKVLRRSSLTTATLSVTTLPAMIMISGNLPSTGMNAIVGTAVVMSVGSTIFLKAMSYPYVTKLEEAPSSTPEDRKLVAYRLGIFGNTYSTEFRLADVESVKVSDHPFASFRVKNDCFFVFEKMIENDEAVKNALRRDKAEQSSPTSNSSK